MKPSYLIEFFFSAVLLPTAVDGSPPVRDVTFAAPNSHALRLDLFLPEDAKDPPLVVFIHGGGWRNNSYKRCLTPWLTEHGFAVASIGYRLSDQTKFPAQVHDCKAAVRWLRAHADEHGYNQAAARIWLAALPPGKLE